MDRTRFFPVSGVLGAGLASLCLILLPPVRGETLTIATYNVENYGPANRVTAVGFRSEYPKPEPEKQALRQVIRALDADVLVLQEMGAAPYLEELRRDLRAEGCDYPYSAVAEAGDADRHVALLSRRPLAAVATVSDLDFGYFDGRERVKRGLLEATIATSAGKVTIFALHLKSRLTERPDDLLCTIRRTGEATAIRDRILRQFPAPADARFVIIGDCNDVKGSKPLERLQHRGELPIGVLLPAVDGSHESWTYFYRREDSYMRFDYVLVSPGLFAAVRGGAARIFDSAAVRGASDHRPVALTLDLPSPR